MKTLVGVLLAVSIFTGVALALDSQYKTRLITSATLTIHVKDGQYIVIRNFTQDQNFGQRGVLVASVIPSTPTPTPPPTPVPTPTPPYLSTQAGPGVALSTGGTLTDTATLVGFNKPVGGTISFTLTGPSPSNAVVDSEGPVNVTGNGDYQTPTGFTTTGTTVAGTYTWHAQYSGDINGNPGRVDNGDNETVVVTATPTPAPTAAPTPTPILAPVLIASTLNVPTVNAPYAEYIQPIVISGPATLTIDPVPSVTIAVTYRKGLQPIQPTPTPTSSVTSAMSSTSSSFSPSKSVSASTTTRSTTVTLSDDDEIEWSTPTPTPSPTPTASPRLRAATTPTPTATPSVTPTATPPSH